MYSETETQTIDTTTQVNSDSPDETKRIAGEFAETLGAGDVVAFFGDLGSGKTTFIAGICEALEVKGNVTSPTFTLIHEYSGRLPVYHFDFYRIENAGDIWQLGWEDYFYGDGVCLIEWADRIRDFLPAKRIEVHLRSCFDQGLPGRREIRIQRL